MVSHLHELLVRLFRTEPSLLHRLAPKELGEMNAVRVEERDPTLSPSNLATTRSADLVLVEEAEDGTKVCIVGEVQLGIDPDKPWSWPHYVAVHGARLRMQTILVVIALDEHVARWARQPIRWLNGTVFRPVVIGPNEIPLVLDPASAARDPIVALLSVLAHASHPDEQALVRATEAAFDALDPEVGPYYTDVVLAALDARAPRLLERFMPLTAPPGYQVQFPPLKALIAKGRAEGEVHVLLRLLERRFGALDASVRTRVEAATLDELDAMADRILDAKSIDEVLR